MTAASAAEGVDPSKTNNDASADPSPKAPEGGVPEDSDADPDADVLAAGSSGLLSGKKEIGQEDYKSADRPWVKNVRMHTCILAYLLRVYFNVFFRVPSTYRYTVLFALLSAAPSPFRTSDLLVGSHSRHPFPSLLSSEGIWASKQLFCLTLDVCPVMHSWLLILILIVTFDTLRRYTHTSYTWYVLLSGCKMTRLLVGVVLQSFPRLSLVS